MPINNNIEILNRSVASHKIPMIADHLVPGHFVLHTAPDSVWVYKEFVPATNRYAFTRSYDATEEQPEEVRYYTVEEVETMATKGMLFRTVLVQVVVERKRSEVLA